MGSRVLAVMSPRFRIKKEAGVAGGWCEEVAPS